MATMNSSPTSVQPTMDENASVMMIARSLSNSVSSLICHLVYGRQFVHVLDLYRYVVIEVEAIEERLSE